MKKVNLTMDNEIHNMLKQIAEKNKTSVSQTVRRLVLEEAKRNKMD